MNVSSLASVPTNEAVRREWARRRLARYGETVHGYLAARHHREWIQRITDLVEGRSEKRKLLIIAPPGSAKSTWISLVFPCWYLGQHPDHSILFFTSSDTMARQFGSTVKATLEGNEEHVATFPDEAVRPDEERGWSTDGLYLQGTPSSSKDPSYRAMGFGASAIGARAHGIIVDDPMTQDQAQSEIEQTRAKAYHDMTVDTRLHPDGWEIAIMTRWHELDLPAHLAAKEDWDVLLMPAIGYWGDDEALWPERYPLSWLRAKRSDLGGAQWDCIYQGDPTSLGGSVFKSAAWLRPLPAGFDQPLLDGKSMRQRLRKFQFWDLAWSAKATADYTASCTAGIDVSGNLYVLHVWRKRIDEEDLAAELAKVILTTRPALVGIEEGAFKAGATKDLLRNITKELTGKGVAIAVIGVPVDRDKVTRARLPAGRAQLGMVYADRDAPWYPEFEAECLGFPLKAHDDQVDALSGVTQIAIEGQLAQQEPVKTKYSMGAPIRQKGFDWQNAGSIFLDASGKVREPVRKDANGLPWRDANR